MPIFTSPVTLNDGVADHVFSFRAQLPDSNLVVAEYLEPAAATKTRSLLTFKHDDRRVNKAIRRLFSRTRMCVSTVDAEVYYPVTINLTATYHPDVSIAEVAKDITIVKNGVGTVNFITNFLQGQI